MAVKLGNGNWAVKEDKLLAYNDNSGLFFNKEFDFSRGTSATYVAKDGFIKTAGIQPNTVNNGDFSELGSELVTNGTFDTDSNWTKTNATISGGKATITVTGGGFSQIFQSISFSSGSKYRITAQVQGLSGSSGKNIRFQDNGSNNGGLSTANGVITLDESVQNIDITWTANSNSNEIVIARSTTSGDYSWTIDNISVKNIAPNWTVTNEDANNYVEFDQDEGTARLKFLNTSPITTLSSATQYLSGKTYKLIVDVKEVVSGSIKVDAAGVSETFNSVGIQQRIIEPTGNSTINFYRATANVDITLNSVSLQEIQTDTPRIDFTNDTKGHLLLEPSRTNLLTYSEDFSQWASGGVNITSNSAISPDGTQNASLFSHSGGSFPQIALSGITFVSSANYVPSLYVKSDGTTQVQHSLIVNGQVVNFTPTNEWVRVSDLIVSPDTSGSFVIAQNSGSAVAASFYIWGGQLEQGDYATSYIPTTGATSTRNADVCNNSGSAQDFNSEEGVLYAEIAALANDSTFRQLTISDSSTSDRVSIDFTSTDNQIRSFSSSSGSTVANMTGTVTDTKQFNKVAVKYKLNDYALWINGSEVATDTSAAAPVGLQELAFDNGGGSNDFYGKVRNVQVFTEALTDEQLQELTS